MQILVDLNDLDHRLVPTRQVELSLKKMSEEIVTIYWIGTAVRQVMSQFGTTSKSPTHHLCIHREHRYTHTQDQNLFSDLRHLVI